MKDIRKLPLGTIIHVQRGDKIVDYKLGVRRGELVLLRMPYLDRMIRVSTLEGNRHDRRRG